jgi:hypothetical protein
MAEDFQNVVYKTDGNVEVKTRMPSYVFAQDSDSSPGTPKVGGRDLTGSDGALLPGTAVKRYRSVLVSNATYGIRTVKCLENTAPLYVGDDTDIDLKVPGVTGVVSFTREGPTGEIVRRYLSNH